ncbi:hypothetical protein ACWGID_16975 [Kribbella sp. NPDC054772]
MARLFGFRSAEQKAADARGQWWDRMSRMVQNYTGRPLRDDANRFHGSDPAVLRSAVCDAMADVYAGDFRHVGLVRGMARQVAVQDVDNMIASSKVPDADRAILDQRAAGEPQPADIRDTVRQVAAVGFTEALGNHLGNSPGAPAVARHILSESGGAGPQTTPIRTAATMLFESSPQAQAMIPPEQHQNAISSIQLAMENEARMLDNTTRDLFGHSGLPSRPFEQTLDETRRLGGDIAEAGIEAVDRMAHPPAPTGQPLVSPAVDVHTAQAAASSGVASAAGAPAGGSGRPDSTSTGARDPRLEHRLDATKADRSGAREA